MNPDPFPWVYQVMPAQSGHSTNTTKSSSCSMQEAKCNLNAGRSARHAVLPRSIQTPLHQHPGWCSDQSQVRSATSSFTSLCSLRSRRESTWGCLCAWAGHSPSGPLNCAYYSRYSRGHRVCRSRRSSRLSSGCLRRRYQPSPPAQTDSQRRSRASALCPRAPSIRFAVLHCRCSADIVPDCGGLACCDGSGSR